MAMRELVGSLEYHRDPAIAALLRRQKERVGTMFHQLDTQYLPQNARVSNGVTFTAWQPQGLERRWNEFMNNKFYLALTKTMKVLNSWLSVMQENWATQALRDGATAQPGDSAVVQADKQGARDLIDDIDALADRLKTLPAWTNPF
jgi:chitinase